MGIKKQSFEVYIKTDERGQYFYAELNGHKYAKRITTNGSIESQCDTFARECLMAEKINSPENIQNPDKEKEADFVDYMFNKMKRI